MAKAKGQQATRKNLKPKRKTVGKEDFERAFCFLINSNSTSPCSVLKVQEVNQLMLKNPRTKKLKQIRKRKMKNLKEFSG